MTRVKQNETNRQNNYMTAEELADILYSYGIARSNLFDFFTTAVGRTLTEEDGAEMRGYLNNVANCIEYRNAAGHKCKRDDSKYLWLSTGLSNNNNEPVLIGFVRWDNEHPFYSYFTGPYYKLEKNLSDYTAEDSKPSLFQELYDSLLRKEEWKPDNDHAILREFLHICESRILATPNLCLCNEDGSKIAYNTGLIDIYGTDIYVMVDNTGSSSKRSIVHSKSEMKQEGFKQTQIDPIQFYDNREELLFVADREDFDLEDVNRLQHVLDERRDRFPEEAKKVGTDVLFTKLRSSIEFNLRMIARNPYWAAPFYNVKSNEIQHLLPLYVTGSFSDAPDLAMVIGKGAYYYEVRTVLPLDKAYANATCLAAPPSPWLK